MNYVRRNALSPFMLLSLLFFLLIVILLLLFGWPHYKVWKQGMDGQAAKDYPEYRKQEFIGAFGEALREGRIQQIIYVPTEANIPIVEAGKSYPAQ
ncbi:hypothetical protein [Acinetobacter variabilis]|uniref:hypothetical protein n=1 Tax=Acinetobacter variabilis TaxID=70346 RepID=UPI00289EC881|nr:hypothetical protein [Acinetobacter variabilis]